MSRSGLAWRTALAGAGCAASLLIASCSGGAGREETAPRETAERPPLAAVASVDPSTAHVGDRVVYAIEADHDASLEIVWPEVGEVLGGLRVLEQGLDEPRRRGDRVVERRWYRLLAVRPGSSVLPEQALEGRRDGEPVGSGVSITVPEARLEVATLLPPDGQEVEIRDIKPLQAPRPRWAAWLAGALLAAALLAALVALWRRRHRQGEEEGRPRRAPHEVALAALEELAGMDLADPVAARRYGFRVSEVVRTYVEGTWGLNATDLTREEILARLGELRGLPSAEAERLGRFLLATDRVKYTGVLALREELGRIHQEALGFVHATRPPEVDDVPAG